MLCAIKKMKIPKDNLTPEQKKNAYLRIFFLVLIICAFIIYRFQYNNKRESLLLNNITETFCKIIETSTFKGRTITVEYIVNGNKYKYEVSEATNLYIGEFYKIKYSNSNPDFAQVDFNKPIIFNKLNYKKKIAKITKTYENSRVSHITFLYKYKNKEYERMINMESISGFQKDGNIEILVNAKNPRISYLSD